MSQVLRPIYMPHWFEGKLHNISAVFAPKGLRNIAQGCRAAATLGKWPSDLQPQRGCVTVPVSEKIPRTRNAGKVYPLPAWREALTCSPRPPLRNPVGVGPGAYPSQGSRCAATLGYVTQPLWGKKRALPILLTRLKLTKYAKTGRAVFAAFY